MLPDLARERLRLGRLGGDVLFENVQELVGRERTTEQVALHFVAAMVPEKGHLGFGLDALGHDVQMQPVGH